MSKNRVQHVRDLRVVLGIGVSWALAYVVFSTGLMFLGGLPAATATQFLLATSVMNLLVGVVFGLGVTRAGRRTRISDVTLVRSLVWAFVACALVRGLHIGIFLYPEIGLETGLRVVIVHCVFGQFVTVLWLLVVRGGARAVTLLGSHA